MNIKRKLNQALLEVARKKSKRKYDYNCVMLNVDIDKTKWDEIQDMIDDEDIYNGTSENGGFGRELDTHITLLFGIHTDVPDSDVEDVIKKIKRPEFKLSTVSSFKNKDFDVLKFDIESKDLHKYNKMFTELPHTTDYPDYHAHCTIAYIISGKVDKYIKKISELDSLDTTSSEILYSKSDGTKKTYKI